MSARITSAEPGALLANANPIEIYLAEQRLLKSHTFTYDPRLLNVYHSLFKKHRKGESMNIGLIHDILLNILHDLSHAVHVSISILLVDLIKYCKELSANGSKNNEKQFFQLIQSHDFISSLIEKTQVWAPWLHHSHLTFRRKAFQIALGLLAFHPPPHSVHSLCLNLNLYFKSLGSTAEIREWWVNRINTTEFIVNTLRDVGCLKQALMLLIQVYIEFPSARRELDVGILIVLGTEGELLRLFGDHDMDLVLVLFHLEMLARELDLAISDAGNPQTTKPTKNRDQSLVRTILAAEMQLKELKKYIDPCRLFCQFLSSLNFDEYTLADIISETPLAVDYFMRILPVVKEMDYSKLDLDEETDYETSVVMTLNDLKSVLRKLERVDLEALILLMDGFEAGLN